MAASKFRLKTAATDAWFEHQVLASFILDQDHNIVAWNRACEELTGVMASEVLGTRDHWKCFYNAPRVCLADLVLDNSAERNSQLYENIARFSDKDNTLGLRAENWVETKTGRKYLLIEANEIMDENGNLIGAVETIRDVTRRKTQEARANLIIEESPAAIYLLEVPQNISSQPKTVNITNAFLAMTGYSRDEWSGDGEFWLNKIHPDDREHALRTLDKLDIGKINSVEYRFLKKNGDYLWVLDQYVAFPIEGFDNLHILGVWMNLDDRKHYEFELKKLSQAIKQSPSAVIITDATGRIEYVNPVFEQMTGHCFEDVIDRKTDFLNAPDSNNDNFRDMYKTVAEEGLWRGELRSIKKDGSIYWSRVSISGIRDENNKFSHYISIQEDVSSEYKLKQKLTYQATHDSLTGLENRDAFETRIKQALSDSRITNSIHAMCYLDLDKFKLVNDTCGHAAGDELLRQLAITLRDKLRSRDVLARIGGDEFAVLMEHCSIENAEKVAIMLRDSIREFRFGWDDKSFNIGVSIGLVLLNSETTDYAEALKHADTACYAAKNRGGNRIHIYHHDDKELAKMHGEMVWVEKIYRALEEDRLILYAQHIIPRNGELDDCFIEILVRLVTETGEVILPGEFLPAAERYNISTKVDTYVFSKISEVIKEKSSSLPQCLRFFINLSGHTISDIDFHNYVISCFNEKQVDPRRICFEVTESAAITNLGMATTFINKMKSYGCKFALDDFGSGLSSFGYLKNMLVDYIKIDGMFVKDIVNDEIDRAMVRSINDVGHVMGKMTIAEYVENNDIKKLLDTIGVDYLQGFGISKPNPLKNVIDVMFK